MRALTTLLLVLAACGPGDEACVEGATEPCTCVGGDDGVRVCDDDGTFGDCACDDACEPATCDVLGAECGPVDDGCDGVVACGTCGDHETCLTNNQCACDDGYVDVDGACLEDACDPDPCDPLEACATTEDGAVCACAEDAVEVASGDCLADLGAEVVDVSARAVTMTVAGVGTFEVHQLSEVGQHWTIVRVTVGASDKPVYDTLVFPPVTLGGVTGAADDLDALHTAVDGGLPLDVSLELRGIAGQRPGIVTYDAVGELLDDREVEVGGTKGLAALRIAPVSRWELDTVVELDAELRPRPRPGVEVEIGGIAIWDFAPGTVDVALTDRERSLPAVPDVSIPEAWFRVNTTYFQDDGSLDYRSASFIQRDASGVETARRNVYDLLPQEVLFFDASRPYGAAPLVTVHTVFGFVEDAD